MSSIGVMAMPVDFRYREVFLKGRPQHDRYDSFRIRHPSMDRGHRAKIFSPFDALKGFDEAIESEEELFIRKPDLSEAEKEELDKKLNTLLALTRNAKAAKKNTVTASVTYFESCPEAGNGFEDLGRIKTVTGHILKVDPLTEYIIRIDDTLIDLADLLDIESPSFVSDVFVY